MEEAYESARACLRHAGHAGRRWRGRPSPVIPKRALLREPVMGSANAASAAIYCAVQLEQRGGARPRNRACLGAHPGQRCSYWLVRRRRGVRWSQCCQSARLAAAEPAGADEPRRPDAEQPALPAGSPFQGIASFLGSVYWTAATAETDANAAKAVNFSDRSITQIVKLQLVPLQGARYWCVRAGSAVSNPPY